jgi:hypothetical protein
MLIILNGLPFDSILQFGFDLNRSEMLKEKENKT